MTSADWDFVVQCATPIISAVVIPWAIMAYQKRTGIQFTAQQTAAVSGALTTAAGIIETRLDRGDLKLADIQPGHPEIIAEADAALKRVPAAAAFDGITLTHAAEVIVGRVDTWPHRLKTP